jgi:predicted O-methyltransferase YrrM
MTDLTLSPKTDPTSIYRCRDGLFASDLLNAALVGLDFFTWLDKAGPQSVAQIAGHFGFQQRPVDVMTTLFVAMGFLERRGETVRTTDTAKEHLVAGSPWFIAPYFFKVNDRPIAADMLTILKTGLPANFASRKNHDDWHKAMETESFAEEFTAMMDCRGVLLSQKLATNLDLSRHRSLLDIAGGSGVFACSLAAHFPHLKATVLEKPPVERVTARAIAKRGFSERVGVIAQDMLAGALPKGHDVHLYSNVLHDWDVPVVRNLLQASAEALPSGGWLVVHDAFLNPDKTGPLHVAEYSVVLMHVTQGRCYSTAEIEGYAADFGFRTVAHVPSAAMRSALVLEKG